MTKGVSGGTGWQVGDPGAAGKGGFAFWDLGPPTAPLQTLWAWL